jgi:hypothetical protein
LLRNARRGRASGYNLVLRATASELVVLLDASRRVPGAGWLDSAVAALLARRELGAVVAREAARSGAGWAWLVPRAVLSRAAGFDEAYDPAGLEDHDMEQQLRALGYALAEWAELGPGAPLHRTGAAAVPADAARRSERHFRRKWRRSAQLR